jgi:hypothetical protein
MDQHALLMYMVMRYRHLDSPELARRRENLASFEREAREARRGRRRAFVRRTLNCFNVFHRDGETRMQPCAGPAVGEVLR